VKRRLGLEPYFAGVYGPELEGHLLEPAELAAWRGRLTA
jgi:hypothetical protein